MKGRCWIGIIRGTPIWLGVWSVLTGLGLGCGQPISMFVAYQSSPASRTGEVLGLITVFYASSVFLLGGTLLIKPPRKE
ncbi:MULTISPECIES: hypothetical protein [unclassified Paenibacillus]|uniref:hypothetical protein n=1 Tax=unclassified Paenibacillus TaxID=185978 RepID=UPI002406B00F|nr:MULTISPECIES: hypothetical protein [unclassified Paenibacillus]MDF9839410.1 MFS family permease [Paenibacillus sp. PastF-2]MDF9845990.1 MFS family permease [Paenibacillus sp. PastM-2]MDF9852563.1 MFS family permease [Paenibacillus sp. PastF-1]MDH6477707.1 MFS family permease [Paenibacillus sp. PastH-2]MDH6505446.1 MFS family permease [Paenibacillus sp. PastM-3]